MDLFPSSGNAGRPTLLGPLERAFLKQWTKSRNPVILSAIQHRQNASYSKFDAVEVCGNYSYARKIILSLFVCCSRQPHFRECRCLWSSQDFVPSYQYTNNKFNMQEYQRWWLVPHLGRDRLAWLSFPPAFQTNDGVVTHAYDSSSSIVSSHYSPNILAFPALYSEQLPTTLKR
jgi:hypothetical protein